MVIKRMCYVHDQCSLHRQVQDLFPDDFPALFSVLLDYDGTILRVFASTKKSTDGALAYERYSLVSRITMDAKQVFPSLKMSVEISEENVLSGVYRVHKRVK